MELDDLKTAWRELDRRLDAGQAITLDVLKEGKLDRSAIGVAPAVRLARVRADLRRAGDAAPGLVPRRPP